MNLFRSAAVLALLAGPLTVSARPRVVIAYVRGDQGGALSRQLRAALCGRFECVPRTTAYTGTRPDFAKARRNGVSGIVFGAVTGKAPNRMLWLALLTTTIEPARTWTLPLRRNGLLAPRSLEPVVVEIERQLAPPRAAAPVDTGTAPPPPRAAPPAQPSAPPPAAEPPAPRRAEAAPRPAPPERALPPPARPAPERPAAGEEAPAAARRWGAVELGAHVAGRKLEYSGTVPAGSGTLQGMSVDAVASPRVRLEVFPAAWLTRGALSGLGAFGEYRRSVGFEVRSGTEKRSAELARLGAGLTWRLPPLTSWKLGLAPAVSYERVDLTVGGGGIAGLPDAHLRGVKAGLGVAVPIGSRLALLLGGGYVRWTSAGDLVKGKVPFFPSGSASAVEAEAGLSAALFGRVSAQLLGEYGSTSYSLDPDPTGTYRASGATDRSLGGRVTVRAEL